jgi:hypothetical protein
MQAEWTDEEVHLALRLLAFFLSPPGEIFAAETALDEVAGGVLVSLLAARLGRRPARGPCPGSGGPGGTIGSEAAGGGGAPGRATGAGSSCAEGSTGEYGGGGS